MPRFRVEHIISGRTAEIKAPFALLACKMLEWSEDDCRVTLLEESPFSDLTKLPVRVNLERRLIESDLGEDWCDSLDGKDVGNGDFLELETKGGWITVRYETNRTADGLKGQVWLEGQDWTKPLEPGMRFRWPACS